MYFSSNFSRRSLTSFMSASLVTTSSICFLPSALVAVVRGVGADQGMLTLGEVDTEKGFGGARGVWGFEDLLREALSLSSAEERCGRPWVGQYGGSQEGPEVGQGWGRGRGGVR